MTHNPCPECVETRRKTIEEVADWLALYGGLPKAHLPAAELILAHFLPKSPAQLLAEECPHDLSPEAAQWVLEKVGNPNLNVEATLTDPAPRYVFGPWVEDDGLTTQWPCEVDVSQNGEVRRAYRIGQSYDHDGRKCPLADDRTLVRIDSFAGSVVCRDVNWSNVTSFTPLDEGKSISKLAPTPTT